MKRIFTIAFALFFTSSLALSQCFLSNPALVAGDITAPLAPGQGGTFTFTYLETFADYTDFAGDPLVIQIAMSNITAIDEENSVGGTLAGSFDWDFDEDTNTLTGEQVEALLLGGGTIIVTFIQDAEGTPTACPDNGMGFDASIIPPACMAGNNTTDDIESSFTCVDNALALPVELTDFTAVLVEEDVVLNWNTASEDNNDRFEIERSFDGVYFEYIGEVAGSGTVSVPVAYTFKDIEVENLGEYELYYRLKQVDTDGTSDYSNVEFIYIDGSLALNLISVEFGGTYRLQESFGEGISTVDIYDMKGVLRSSDNHPAVDVADLITDGLENGSYIVVINKKHRKKMIIAR